MIARAAIAAVLLAAFVFPAQAQDCRLKQVASLDATPTSEKLLLVPVTVDGSRVQMLLDTGAVRGVIDAGLAARLGLEPLKISQPQPVFIVPEAPLLAFTQIHGPSAFLVNGIQLDHFTKVPSLEIGASQANDVAFLLAKIDEPGAPDLKGIIGANILRNFDLEVDPHGGKVNLFSPDHCDGKVVYWADAFAELPVKIGRDNQIELVMTLDGQDVATVLDTGASNTTLDSSYARRAFDMGSDSPGVTRVSDDGKPAVYRARFKSLGAGGISVSNPEIYLAPDAIAARKHEDEISGRAFTEHESAPGPKLVLGMDVLSKLHIYIAYGEKKLYFTAADAH